ncbi:hypothetical protein ABH289_09905 [Acinetobacter pittii]|uniref:hypothetical protein n=1 Tax=Acinetobacter pittii TaxID=48296 RepID=UPI00208E01D9|nr:hypothetical protein [Acinetobacter pittii]
MLNYMCKQSAAIFYVDYSLKHSRFYVNDKAGYKVLSNFSGKQKYHFNESVISSLRLHSDGGLWK